MLRATWFAVAAALVLPTAPVRADLIESFDFRVPISGSLSVTLAGLPTFNTVFTSAGLPDSLFVAPVSGVGDAELATMDMRGPSPFGEGRVRIGHGNGLALDLPATLGEFDVTTGQSFFDVFFELALGGSVFYNAQPLHMVSSNVDQVPLQPGAHYSLDGGPVNVFVLGTNDLAGTIDELTWTLENTQDVPSFPSEFGGGTFFFDNVVSGFWFDPPFTAGFEYEMLSDSLFTHILDFPTGFSDTMSVVVNGTTVASNLGAGDSVDFTGFAGGGVSSFTVLGINPLVDSEDPLGFPLQLAFNTPTADFQMTAVAPVPEPGTLALLATGLGTMLVRRRFRRRA